ncbi:MAG: GNAT family N-acetyltransferase, partial [Candidatus Bathyarchaeia archaeon]
MSFEGRPYQEGDEKGIVELLNLVWDGWPHLDLDCSPLEHWRWKYKANPIKKRFIMVAESDGRIIGCHHSIPVHIKVGDETLFCTTGADLAVHPGYRGLVVYRKLSREL